MQNILFILPELFISIGVMTLLMLGVFIKNGVRPHLLGQGNNLGRPLKTSLMR